MNLPEARRVVQSAQRGIPLTEASLSRVYKHWLTRGFAIVSADRGERTASENKHARKALKSAIRSAGYGFIPLNGFWFETDADTGERRKVGELAFLVPDHQDDFAALRAHVVRWGKIDAGAPQEAVIFTHPGGPVEFLDPTNGRLQFALRKFVPGRVADIYSKLAKRGPGATFVFEGWNFVAPPTSQVAAYRRRHEGEITFVSA